MDIVDITESRRPIRKPRCITEQNLAAAVKTIFFRVLEAVPLRKAGFYIKIL